MDSLLYLRNTLNWTVRQIASSVGVTQTTVYKWLTLQMSPRMRNQIKMDALVHEYKNFFFTQTLGEPLP
jgi:transcriptional regulator with XRE-family HTH domain